MSGECFCIIKFFHEKKIIHHVIFHIDLEMICVKLHQYVISNQFKYRNISFWPMRTKKYVSIEPNICSNYSRFHDNAYWNHHVTFLWFEMSNFCITQSILEVLIHHKKIEYECRCQEILVSFKKWKGVISYPFEFTFGRILHKHRNWSSRNENYKNYGCGPKIFLFVKIS